MINTLEDLSGFLHRWYGESPGALALETIEDADGYAPPLVKAWSLFGGLLRDSKKWFDNGKPTPLCCQDGFALPSMTMKDSEILHVAFENQGNWSFGYKHKSESADPRVFSDWIWTQVDYDPGFVQIGAKLSDFLITLCLSETIYFGWDQTPSKAKDALQPSDLSGERLWEGRYHNAMGFGDALKLPSNIIQSNASQTELALYQRTSKGMISPNPFVAKRSIARDRYQKWKAVL